MLKRANGFTLFSFIIGMFMLSALFVPVSISQNPVEKVNGTPAGWSDDIPLCDYTFTNQDCALVSKNESIYVVWVQDAVDLIYRKSNDGGRTWNQNKTLTSSPDLVRLPDISLYHDNIHLVWNDYEGWNGVYYRNSTDGGETWNPTKRISSDGVNAGGPYIFVNISNAHIIWMDQRDGADGEIYYRRSLDGGITFDNGQGVDEDRRITFSPAPITSINMDGEESNISVVWGDERDGDWEIYWMITKDNGFTWEDGLGTPDVGRKLTDSSNDSTQPAVAVNGSQIHIIWLDESWPGPEYRLFYRNSTDNGATWNTPQLLTGPTPGIASPSIDVEGDNVYVVWDDRQDDGDHHEVYYKCSNDSGISWSADLRLSYNLSRWSLWPRISVENDTKHLVWWDKITNVNHQVMYKRSPDFPDPTYNITLNEGWNLVSLPLEQSDESLDQVLSSITGKWDIIQIYDPLSPEPWKTNNTYKPESLNDFDTLNHKVGFWINITEPGGVNLTVSGYIPTSTTIPLYAGWNLVGYPTLNDTMTVANALFGTTADSVEVFDLGEPYRIKEVGPTYVMKPGEGYWVHLVEDSVWVVDW